MTTDAVLTVDQSTQLYDFELDENGDIKTSDFFDTAILYSLFGEKRASVSEVVEPQLRRGWIGNGADFENGSKLWLLSQARLSRETLNRIEDEAEKSLQWMVSDGIAVSIDRAVAGVANGKVTLSITIRRTRDKVVSKFFVLWENTGRAN